MPPTLELHPLCTLFPRLTEQEALALQDDIKANGLREPITLHNGMILDGGNRYRACLDAGVEPAFTDFDGTNIVSFVLSANLHRRHLTPGQQAAIVASAQDWAKAQTVGNPAFRAQSGNVTGLATVAARAAQSGASDKTQRMADKVARADPSLAKAVAHGQVSLPNAVAQVSKKPAKPKRSVSTKHAEVDSLTTDDELMEARHTITDLAEENDRLRDRIAVESMDASEEAKTEAAHTIEALRTENKALRAELEAVKVSRDQFQNENASMKRHIATQRREIERLKRVETA